MVKLLYSSHKPTTRFYMEMTIMDEKNNYNYFAIMEMKKRCEEVIDLSREYTL